MKKILLLTFLPAFSFLFSTFMLVSLPNHCSAQCSVTASVVSNVSCNGACNGVAVANPAGGTPPYTYQWIPSSCGTQTCTGLCPGPYAVMITDAVGCTASSTLVTITQPPALTANAQVINNVLCHGQPSGNASVTVTGGTGPYTYTWSTGSDFDDTLNYVPAGIYVVNVT